MAVKFKDVAKRAGVSVTGVSRVLNGKIRVSIPHLVDSEWRPDSVA